eukprot:jgi/Chrpa1/2038/Chrysochromulina_OHIO_Genome00010722-RA
MASRCVAVILRFFLIPPPLSPPLSPPSLPPSALSPTTASAWSEGATCLRCASTAVSVGAAATPEGMDCAPAFVSLADPVAVA